MRRRSPGNPKKPLPAEYKFRTRAHVIADLSVNHVERLVLQAGHALQRMEKDYGYDLQVFTFDHGSFENGYIYLQLKATDALKLVDDGKSISFTLDRADVYLWYNELMPVFLIVWDAAQEVGYWLYLQSHLKRIKGFPILSGQETLTVRLPTANLLDGAAVERFRQYKNRIQRQLEKMVDHDD